MSVAEIKEKLLFTPGPLTTSRTVRQALLRDLGSRDFEFIRAVREIREKLVSLAGSGSAEYTTILMQGSGTFSVEAVLSSTIPPDGKLLVIVNGAYGKRMVEIARTLKIATEVLTFPENAKPELGLIEERLKSVPAICQVAVVHCETTTGIMNPVKEIGRFALKYGKTYFVDAMSSFGAVPLDLKECGVDFLVSSANKCIEGVPGFGFILAREAALKAAQGWARSVSLDLFSQWKGLESNGQFRFTPPTHVLLAFRQALAELDEEGGVEGRAARYRANHKILVAGMRRLGFAEYLNPEDQGYIITSFRYPKHPRFEFERFYFLLNEKDFVIYPGKVSNADCFRIGNIGRLFEADIEALLAAIRETLIEMAIDLQSEAKR